ncbi:hypothetical protein HID58_071647 [Brassica napus]|uniref:Transmembrane protein n=3 Tax=Brassica napus TaxID=3708 RepID=A0ABQ7Z2C0_BRANA|nr:hypothetical protein HID58_071647 [Brassica napus]CDY25060.1 BnaC06g18020D [Brassica napus]
MIDGERERERESTRRRRICLVSACAFGGTDSLGLEEILRWSSLGRGGSHNTIFAGFCLREEVIPLHRLRRLSTAFVCGLVVLRFSMSYELLSLVVAFPVDFPFLYLVAASSRILLSLKMLALICWKIEALDSSLFQYGFADGEVPLEEAHVSRS